MTPLKLIVRSLVFYRRTHAGVVLGAAVATAVLVGALAVGDSVRFSLRRTAMIRLGRTALAMTTGDGLFRDELARQIQQSLGAASAPALLLSGTASNPDSNRRANEVQVLGVDRRFWALGQRNVPPGALEGAPDPLGDAQDGSGAACLAVNRRLAEKLGCRTGDWILLRVHKPALLPSEAPLSVADRQSAAARMKVVAVIADQQMGRFNLASDQLAPYSAFVPMGVLQGLVGSAGKANLLLVADKADGARPDTSQAGQALKDNLRLADLGLELRHVGDRNTVELRGDRVFLAEPVVQAAARISPSALGVLTYFVNELRAGDRATPYSMVSAVGPLAGDGPLPPPLEGELADDAIAINQWLADDLQAGEGDRIGMTYPLLGPMRTLTEGAASFTVGQVVPMTGLAGDADLMPSFPGLADAGSCVDWKPGVPIDLDKIRKKDEQYWDEHRGAPKAFVSLKTGQRLWSNRFGSLTAVRWESPPPRTEAVGPSPADGPGIDQLGSRLLAEIDPAALGMRFRPVAEEALAASSQGMDFGQLFLGMSVFLVVAGLLLMALLLALGADQRAWETGMLLALGWRKRTVRRVLLAEACLLALGGTVIGAFAGLGYTRAVVFALNGVWAGAVAGTGLVYSARATTVLAGAAVGLAVAAAAAWVVLRSQVKRPARELLGRQGGLSGGGFSPAGRRVAPVSAAVSLAVAVGIIAYVQQGRGRSAVGAFFTAGALLLAAGLLLSWWLLSSPGRGPRAGRLSRAGLALRNATRRRARSLAVVAVLACGTFLIVAVAANRQAPARAAAGGSAGAGGFKLLARSSLPIIEDMNGPAAREALGLTGGGLAEMDVVALRVQDGDDASCLNLNRAQSPRLLGVAPEALDSRGAFAFVGAVDGAGTSHPWRLLDSDLGPDVAPAVGDENTVVWGLAKRLGDDLDYVDQLGRSFKVRIVGIVSNSILQGSLLISQANFEKRFPAQVGFREFLIDTQRGRSEAVAAALERAFEDSGMDARPAGEVLAGFQEVENTYLSIFQALGGLGLVLGGLAVGIVAGRNIMERKGELAVMRAVGFTSGSIRRLTAIEHGALVLMGLVVGVLSALIAVLPAIRSWGSDVPWLALAATLAVVAAAALASVWVSCRLALGGPLIDAIRNE